MPERESAPVRHDSVPVMTPEHVNAITFALSDPQSSPAQKQRCVEIESLVSSLSSGTHAVIDTRTHVAVPREELERLRGYASRLTANSRLPHIEHGFAIEIELALRGWLSSTPRTTSDREG